MIKRLYQEKFTSSAGELNLFKLLAVLTIIPTLLAMVYYVLIASDIYVSETKFSIYSNEPTTPSIDLGNLAGLASGVAKNGDLEQLLVVSEYIKSYDLLKKLDEKINIKAIFSKNGVDFISKLDEQHSIKEFLDYYNKMVEVRVNREAYIIELKVRAFSSEDAFLITKTINQLTEAFVNKLLNRVKKDELSDAREFLNESQTKIKNTQYKSSDFRVDNKTLDPKGELMVQLEFIKALETKKAELTIQKNELKNTMSNSNINMAGLDAKIMNMNKLIAQTKNKILVYQSEDADVIRNYEMLKLDEEFAREEYKLALMNLEKTIKEQSSKNKYLVEVLRPTLPDYPTEPERFLEILTVFISCFLGFGIISLIIAGIRDHIVV